MRSRILDVSGDWVRVRDRPVQSVDRASLLEVASRGEESQQTLGRLLPTHASKARLHEEAVEAQVGVVDGRSEQWLEQGDRGGVRTLLQRERDEVFPVVICQG